MMKYSEKERGKKIAFREKYGRKPTKAEIKMLKKNQIDLGNWRPRLSTLNIQEQMAAKQSSSNFKDSTCVDV
jgi:hypothetical protein